MELNLDLDMKDYQFDSGNLCSDEQYLKFLSGMLVNKEQSNKFTNGLLLFYANNGATNAKSTLGFSVKYNDKHIVKYTMQDMSNAAVNAGTTIRQICRKYADHTVLLLEKSKLETRIYKKYKDAPRMELTPSYAFDSANYAKGITKTQTIALYKIKINKLTRRKIISKYEECPFVYRDSDEIIRDDKLGKQLYMETITDFKLDQI
jgi:hypothetical protein